jgi:adenine phosphoribosyltransferase
MSNLADKVRNVPDFPIPGIQFKDITTLLRDAEAFRQVVDTFAERYTDRGLDAVVGIESRGFILSAPLAYRLGVGLVPVRAWWWWTTCLPPAEPWRRPVAWCKWRAPSSKR